MADVAAGYWSLDASDEEQQMVYVPGVSKEGNMRPAPNFKRTEDPKPKISLLAPTAQIDLIQNWQNQREQQASSEEGGIRSASLKDLCPEDKRRIANLIKELARVSEEKEVTEERLKTEQESFEKKIRQLEEQNNLIVTEREALQQQYRECQELLSLYQKYLSEQQEKLNRSLSELSAGSKPQQVSVKIARQPTSSELDGSYLCSAYSQPYVKPMSESGSSHSHGTNRLCRSEPNSRLGFCCKPRECALENGAQRRCGSVGCHEVYQPQTAQGHHCRTTFSHQDSICCLHCTTPNMPGRQPPEVSTRGPTAPCSFKHSSTSLLGNGVTRPKVPANVQSLSEDRKHQLLLQKMELELEKERLQQLLEQQEEKLILKQQQLHQSRQDYKDYNRSQAAPESPLTDDLPAPSCGPMTNGFQYSPAKPSSADLCTPLPRKNGKKSTGSVSSSAEKKVATFTRSPHEGLSLAPPQDGFSKGSRKYSSRSPAVARRRRELVTTATSPVCRYETSLIDMLEAISPISKQRLPAQHREPCDFSIVSPAPMMQPGAPRRPAPTDDPEESRMLEEIFFIC